MNTKQKDLVLDRAIDFIQKNTKKDSFRIGIAITEELKLLKHKNRDNSKFCKIGFSSSNISDCSLWNRSENGCKFCENHLKV